MDSLGLILGGNRGRLFGCSAGRPIQKSLELFQVRFREQKNTIFVCYSCAPVILYNRRSSILYWLLNWSYHSCTTYVVKLQLWCFAKYIYPG